MGNGVLFGRLFALVVGLALTLPSTALSHSCPFEVSDSEFQNYVKQIEGASTEDQFCGGIELGSLNCADTYRACEPLINQMMQESIAMSQQASQVPTNGQAEQALGGEPKRAAMSLFPNFYQPISEAKEKCFARYNTAKTACNPVKNEQMSEIGEAAAQILQTLGGSLGAQMACTGVGDLLKNATGALAAFQGTCSGLKKLCDDSCNEARDFSIQARSKLEGYCPSAGPQTPNLANLVSAVPSLAGLPPQQQAQRGCQLALEYFNAEVSGNTARANEIAALPEGQEAELDSTANTIRDAARLCENFNVTLQKAAANGLQFMNMESVSQQCAQDSSELPGIADEEYCVKNPDLPECQSFTDVDCSDPATAQSDLTCLCKTNPSNPMCKTVASSGRGVAASPHESADFSSKLGDDAFDAMAGGGPQHLQMREPTENKGHPGLGGLGSAGGSGGFSGSNNSMRGSGGGGGGSCGGSGYDENVILGTGGGRGGGGRGGANFRRTSSTGDSGLQRFLPKIGAQANKIKKEEAEKNQITGPGGPSNFDKVSQRYRANWRTLLPE